MKQNKAKNQAGPLIPEWKIDKSGTITAVRDASFWRSLPGGAVACCLCYRNCILSRGEDGWCGYRANERGRMVLKAHGQIGALYRILSGYGLGDLYSYPGTLCLEIGALHCTARCSFCCCAGFSTHPDRLPWAYGRPYQLGRTAGWWGFKAMLHPAGVIAEAQRSGCTSLFFTANEPLLSAEYVYDCARLAKAQRIDVAVLSNGFSTEAAVRKLAPYISGVKIGLKGSGDEEFYTRYMRSAGALETVYKSILAWRDAGVGVSVSDTLAALHMQTDERAEEHQKRLYGWVADQLGAHSLLHVGGMHKYNNDLSSSEPLLSSKAGPDAAARHEERTRRAVQIAREAGLVYAEGDDAGRVVRCHACGGDLVRMHEPRREGDLEIYRPHEQHVTGGRCDHCGAAVPVRVLSPAQLAANFQRWRDDPPLGATIRIEA